LLPVNRTAHQVRCPSGHLLAEMASPPYRFTCPRCKRSVVAA
jgi:phage FluMu protein Com